ncbi:MAG TPA: hypothetical protein VGL20_08830 [Candidatus Dormibacteraeota bacterium]
MTSVTEIERALDSDPLAVRLSEAEVPSVSAELWAAVLSGARPAPKRRHRRRLIAGLGGGAVALSLLVVTPAGASIARAVLPHGLQQRLGLVVGAPAELTPPGGRTVAGSHASGSALPCSQVPHNPPTLSAGSRGGTAHVSQQFECYPDLGLTAAQGQVSFTIPTPTSLPSGVTFRGALVASAHSVFLTYRDASSRKTLGLWVTKGAPVGGSAVPSAQRVQVDGGPAFYVHGSYDDSGPGTTARWNPAADAEELTWQHDGMTYDLTATGLHFSSTDLIRIAESVR